MGRLISANFENKPWARHITLTFKNDVFDPLIITADFYAFWRRFKRRFACDYLMIPEPNERGAWHVHLLLKTKSYSPLFLSHSGLQALWGQGHIFLSPVNVDLLVWYFNPFFNKKKGKRLAFYPLAHRVFRKSRGIRTPVPETMAYCETRDMVSGMKLEYHSIADIVEGNEVVNSIHFQRYKKNLE